MKLQLPSFTKNFHHDVYDAIDPTRAELSLAGKNVLVTGGGQGIGAAITSTFAIAGAANIIILGRTLDTLNAVKSKVESREGNKSKVHVFQADISDETRINQIFDEVVKSVGQVDIYIANAAYLPEPVTVMATQVDDFWRGFEANVKGGFIVARAFLKVASENAVLINVSSGVAHIRYMTPGASYAGSKVAGVRLMDHIAVENPHLRVYNLQPGVIQSGMSHKSGLSWAPGSLDRAELPAAFCVWLSSAEGEFLRGRFIYANWDVDEMKARKEEIIANPDFLTLNLMGFPFEYATEIEFGAEVEL